MMKMIIIKKTKIMIINMNTKEMVINMKMMKISTKMNKTIIFIKNYDFKQFKILYKKNKIFL